MNDNYDERLLKADHVNLQDGILYDVDGFPLAMGEDTKISLRPTGPGVEHTVAVEENPGADVERAANALQQWRKRQQRK